MFPAKHLIGSALGGALLLAGLATASTSDAGAPKPDCHQEHGRRVCSKPKPKPATYSILEFVIATGDDDLRGDSTAWANVKRPNGKSKTCDLKTNGQDSWGNGSTHAVTCELGSPMTLDNLRRTKVTIGYNGFGGGTFETQDNWNLNSVVLRVYDQDRKPICIFSASGNPLHRFQGLHGGFGVTNDSVTVTDFPSGCR